MFEAVPQELKESVEKVLRSASRGVYDLLNEVEKLVDEVSEQLDAWADELADDEPDDVESAQSMYDYLVQNSAGSENASLNSARAFLLSDLGYDALVGLYESKKATSAVEDLDWTDPDWWAGKTDKY